LILGLNGGGDSEDGEDSHQESPGKKKIKGFHQRQHLTPKKPGRGIEEIRIGRTMEKKRSSDTLGRAVGRAFIRVRKDELPCLRAAPRESAEGSGRKLHRELDCDQLASWWPSQLKGLAGTV